MIDSVSLHQLDSHLDERGSLTEIFRQEWSALIAPVQWNLLRSQAGALRGVHCHVRHADALIVAEGELVLGLIDLRPGSPTEGQSELHRIGAVDVAVIIPPGVAHGFAFEQPTTMVYGVSEYWNLADELGCRWDDPGLNIDWPLSSPLLSERDSAAGSLDVLRETVAAHLGTDRR